MLIRTQPVNSTALTGSVPARAICCDERDVIRQLSGRGIRMTVAAPTGLDLRALLTEGTHLIGGEWVPAWSGETFDVINPATQDVLLPVPRGGPYDVDAAATAAAAAFPPWRDTSRLLNTAD
jgi:Aldehyde dehydrogenase family